jgi:hypothetical protein
MEEPCGMDHAGGPERLAAKLSSAAPRMPALADPATLSIKPERLAAGAGLECPLHALSRKLDDVHRAVALAGDEQATRLGGYRRALVTNR